METNDELDSTLWRAYPDSKVDLWDQNFVNDKYVIAYEIDTDLHPTLKNMLPKVSCLWRSVTSELFNHWLIKAMEKIEEVTCIKFEERSENNHQELVL